MTRSQDGRLRPTLTLNIRIILAKFRHKWYLTKNNDMANISQINDAMLGGGGRVRYFGAAAVTNLLCDYIILRGNGSFTVLTDEDGVNLITELNLTSLNLPAFWIVRAPYGKKIKDVTHTFGGAAYWF